MAKKVVLYAGFLPLVTEGNLVGGGMHDVRRPHLPENVGLFKKVANGDGDYQLSQTYKKYSIFRKRRGGNYKRIKFFGGESKYDRSMIRKYRNDDHQGEFLGTYPNKSGLTIGLGFDIGASYDPGTQSKLDQFFKKIATKARQEGLDRVADDFVRWSHLFQRAVGLRGVPALEVTADLRNKIRLTKQHVFYMLHAMWLRKESSTASYVKRVGVDFYHIYPPLREVLIRWSYANGNWTIAFAKILFKKGINKTSGRKKWIKQCDIFIDAMSEYKTDKCRSYGFRALVKRTREVLKAGGSVEMSKDTIKLRDIYDDNSAISDWMDYVMYDAKRRRNFTDKLMASDAQETLNDEGFRDDNDRPLLVDGDFGKRSQEALRKFQKENDLAVNGKLDEATKEALFFSKYSDDVEPDQLTGSVGPGKSNEFRDVEMVQKALQKHGYAVRVDGVFGPQTQRMVQDFQERKGLQVDGLITPSGETWGALSAPYDPNDAPQLQKIQASVGRGGKNRGQDVGIVQQLLNRHGFDLVVDGDCGPKTIRAIEAFQKSFLRKPDGQVDPGGKTEKKLRE